METLKKTGKKISDCKPTKEQQQPDEGKSNDTYIDLACESPKPQRKRKPPGAARALVPNPLAIAKIKEKALETTTISNEVEVSSKISEGDSRRVRLSGAGRKRLKALLEQGVPRATAVEIAEQYSKKSASFQAAIRGEISGAARSTITTMEEAGSKTFRRPSKEGRPQRKMSHGAVKTKSVVEPYFRTEFGLGTVKPTDVEMNGQEKIYTDSNRLSPVNARLNKPRTHPIDDSYPRLTTNPRTSERHENRDRFEVAMNVTARSGRDSLSDASKRTHSNHARKNSNRSYDDHSESNPPAPKRIAYSDHPNVPKNQVSSSYINNATSRHESFGHKKVGLMPLYFPMTLWNMEQLETIQRAVLERTLYQQEAAMKPQFQGSAFHEGWLSFTCTNQATVNWLKRLVPSLKPWRGASAQVVEEIFCIGYFPASTEVSTEKILAILEAQNSGLDVGEWRILERAERDDDVRLIIALGLTTAEKINNGRLELGYGFGSVLLQPQSLISGRDPYSCDTTTQPDYSPRHEPLQREQTRWSRPNVDLYGPNQPTYSNERSARQYRSEHSRSSNRSNASSLDAYTSKLPRGSTQNERSGTKNEEVFHMNSNVPYSSTYRERIRSQNEKSQTISSADRSNPNASVAPSIDPIRPRNEKFSNIRASIPSSIEPNSNTSYSSAQRNVFGTRNETNGASSYGRTNNSNVPAPPLVDPDANGSLRSNQHERIGFQNGKSAYATMRYTNVLNEPNQRDCIRPQNEKLGQGLMNNSSVSIPRLIDSGSDAPFLTQQDRFRNRNKTTEPSAYGRMSNTNASGPPLIEPNSNASFSSTQRDRFRNKNESIETSSYGRRSNNNASGPPLIEPNSNASFSSTQRDRFRTRNELNETTSYGRMGNTNVSAPPLIDPNSSATFALAQRKLASLVNGSPSKNQLSNSKSSWFQSSGFQNNSASFNDAKNSDASFCQPQGSERNHNQSSNFNQPIASPPYPPSRESNQHKCIGSRNDTNFYNELNNSNATFTSVQPKNTNFQQERYSSGTINRTNASLPQLFDRNQRDCFGPQREVNETSSNYRNTNIAFPPSLDLSQRGRIGSGNEGRNALEKGPRSNQWVVGYNHPKSNIR